MARKILAVLAGLLAGGLIVFAVESVNVALFPLPAGANPQDPAAFKAYVATLPVAAFILVLVAHALGSLAGSSVATLVARRASRWPGLIVGGVLLLGGAINLAAIPHPLWFAIMDVAIYLPAAYLGVRLWQKPPEASPTGA